MSLTKDKQMIRDAIPSLVARVQKLTPWQKVVSVEVPGSIGVWDAEKVMHCLEHMNSSTNSFADADAVTNTQSLLEQVNAAVDALEKEQFQKKA